MQVGVIFKVLMQQDIVFNIIDFVLYFHTFENLV